VAIPAGVFDADNCAIFIFRSSMVGCVAFADVCAWARGKYCIALNEPEKHRPTIESIIAVLMIFTELTVTRV
jgi:hypothetical protein